MKSRQSGITLVGFLFMLLVFGFFAFMAMKLVPAYVSYFSLSKAMTQVATEGVDGKTQNDVRRDFMFKLSFQYADQLITPQNIKFTRVEDGTDMEVTYDQRIPFISNIDFLLHFDKTVKLKGNLY
jgi:outer membrane receptor for Fe3+-dicitrate